MVDSVSRTAANSLIRAQATGISAGIAALKGNQAATRAIIEQLQKGVDQGKVLANQNAAKPLAQSGAPLPRGSLIVVMA